MNVAGPLAEGLEVLDLARSCRSTPRASTRSVMPQAVLGRRAVERPVDGVAAQVEVQVVLERDADAAVELHAVLHQLGAVLRR